MSPTCSPRHERVFQRNDMPNPLCLSTRVSRQMIFLLFPLLEGTRCRRLFRNCFHAEHRSSEQEVLKGNSSTCAQANGDYSYSARCFRGIDFKGLY